MGRYSSRYGSHRSAVKLRSTWNLHPSPVQMAGYVHIYVAVYRYPIGFSSANPARIFCLSVIYRRALAFAIWFSIRRRLLIASQMALACISLTARRCVIGRLRLARRFITLVRHISYIGVAYSGLAAPPLLTIVPEIRCRCEQLLSAVATQLRLDLRVRAALVPRSRRRGGLHSGRDGRLFVVRRFIGALVHYLVRAAACLRLSCAHYGQSMAQLVRRHDGGA
jgi:hypothetical protein